MFKKRFISMLVLLMTAATGAWADTTVTWTASDMSGIYIDFLDGEAYNNTIKGITVTSSGGGRAGDGWERTDINLYGGSTTITFTSSVGKIKSIAITAEDIMMSSTPSGWTTDYSKLSWSGEEASTTVSLPLSGGTEISDISGIVFTIESTVNVTGITLDKTEASMIVGGETLTLTPTVAPGNATDKSVTWSSSNEAVATVSNDGVVTAVAAGTATITVTTTDGAKTATCAVTVAAPAASTYTVTLKEGTEDATSWTIAPVEATTTGVEAGTEVKATYNGTKKVKSVKAKKKAPAATDLSTINANYIASDGETLTGTLASNVKISIADGATVTLNNVTINGTNDSYWAGITCEGDATIILSGTNTVKGFYGDYPGIQAAAGKTLTINGTGSLTASSNGDGAGIGGGRGVACGNIEIQGGTITATGGEYAAGIGGAYNANWGNITISGGTVTATGGYRGAGIGGGKRGPANVSCGNITISGGTVTATGGEEAAGIGGGRGNNNSQKSSCGTITITTGVTKVTATKGSDAPNSIGAGYYGTCGTVTIGGNVGAITTSPYTYQP